MDEQRADARVEALGPLDGLVVVDVTDLRGALCGRILGDLGADVVHLDPPGSPVERSSSAYRYRNANKRGSGVDLSSPEGREQLDGLLARADVLIDNVDLDRRESYGVEPASISQRHPHLIHVALTDLGLTGPRAGWRLEALPALAASGALHASGFPDLPPCAAPGYLAHDCGSVHGALGAVAALMDRERHGRGQLVEVSAQEAALAGTTPWSVAIPDYLHVNPYLPAEGRRNADGVYWVLPAADGWVRTVIGSKRQWDGFVALLGSPDALTGPEWDTPGFRLMNGDVVRLVAQDCLVDRTRSQLFQQALGTGATIGVLHSPLEFVDHEQTRSRGYFAATDFPGLGDAPFAQFPIRMSLTPPSLRRAAPDATDASEAADAVDATHPTEKGVPAATNGESSATSTSRLLLEGVRVVEFGVAAVVPELCGELSTLGADVIKIESTAHPDVLRQTGGERINCGFAFNAECRGRRSVALDLSTEEGRAIALELCASADVVAENHRGGVLDRLGLGYDAVRARNPNVIYVSSQGYGNTGPLGEMPAYGPLNAGFAGVHLLWNHPHAPYPCGTSLNHPDHIAGKLLAVSVLAALRHRSLTGEGQRIDMAQTEAAAYFIGEVYLDAALNGADPAAIGNGHPDFAPHGVYPSAGDDRWVAIAVTDDIQWAALVDIAGWSDDPDIAVLATGEARRKAHDLIDARLCEWTIAHRPDDAAAILQRAGISAMPVMGPLHHREDAHLIERSFLDRLEHPEAGVEHHVGNPVRYSVLATRTPASAPCLGADTEAVLKEVVGLSSERIIGLAEAGILR